MRLGETLRRVPRPNHQRSTFLQDDHQDANGVVAVYPNSLSLPSPIPSRVGNVGQTGNPYNPGQATYNEQGTDNFVEAGTPSAASTRLS